MGMGNGPPWFKEVRNQIAELIMLSFVKLDKLSPRDIAANMAYEFISKDGSPENAMTYMSYTSLQQPRRRSAIERRFDYLNTPSNILVAQKEFERIGRA